MLSQKRLYKHLKWPKRQEAFRDSYHREITLYETANRYLRQHLNGRNEIPLKSLKEELEKLTAEKNSLYREYYSLKEQPHEVENIRKSVYDILRGEAREQRPQPWSNK